VVALAGGEIDLSFGTIVAMKHMIDAGKVRLLAVSGNQRLKNEFSNLPTFKELGFDFEWGTWEALLGPKGLQENKEALTKLTMAAQRVTSDPAFIEKMRSTGFDVSFLAGRDFEQWINELDRKTKAAFDAAGMKLQN
jgi:putative tricarboxylic transport membrane protein